MPRPKVSPAHRKFTRSTQHIFERQQARATEKQQQLDYTLDDLRYLVAKALRFPVPDAYWPCVGVGMPCPLCKQPLSVDDFQVDHDHPIERGGSFSYDNLVVCHTRCNQLKGTRTWAEVHALPDLYKDAQDR